MSGDSRPAVPTLNGSCAEPVPPYLSGGEVGLRPGRDPLAPGVCIVSGLAGVVEGDEVEGFARAPYPLAVGLGIDGRPLHGAGASGRRSYDLAYGELTTSFAAGPAKVEVLAFCSRTMPTLVLQEVAIEVERPCDVEIWCGVDPRGIGGREVVRMRDAPSGSPPAVDGSLLWETPGALSRCGVAYVTDPALAGGRGGPELGSEGGPMGTRRHLHAEPGRRYALRQITSLVPSAMHAEPHRQAVRLAAAGAVRGWERLREDNRQAWRDLWRGRIRLLGADRRWQDLADAAFYYLNASANAGSLFSTSMFGLAYWPNYHYYEGHVMWDIEAFAFPALLLLQPEAAGALLTYRFEHLDAARRNAAMNGYQGLQFPWASGPLSGEESIRTSAPRLHFEQHVNPEVLGAFADYWFASGDPDFLRERAWPVAEGVARWIGSRIAMTDRGAEILEALGIAEQERPGNNNVYMNMACAQALRTAAQVARALERETDAQGWESLASTIHLPRAEDGELLHQDGFEWRPDDPASGTPEALAGVMLMGYRLDPAECDGVLRRELERAGAYIGYPMLSAPLGAAAARLGDRASAARLFEEGYADFIHGPWLETDEFSRTRYPDRPLVGPFMANIGGFLRACLYWLPRLRLDAGDPAAWPEGPVTMPELWDGIEVERVAVRGRGMSLRALEGRAALLE